MYDLDEDILSPDGFEEEDNELGILFADRINTLAALFYQANGRIFDSGINFRKSKHPEEYGCWNMAVIAFSFINNDPTLLRHQVR